MIHSCWSEVFLWSISIDRYCVESFHEVNRSARPNQEQTWSACSTTADDSIKTSEEFILSACLKTILLIIWRFTVRVLLCGKPKVFFEKLLGWKRCYIQHKTGSIPPLWDFLKTKFCVAKRHGGQRELPCLPKTGAELLGQPDRVIRD